MENGLFTFSLCFCYVLTMSDHGKTMADQLYDWSNICQTSQKKIILLSDKYLSYSGTPL